MNLSKFTKTNILLSFLIIIAAFIYPAFIEKIFYSNKSQEAISIVKMIQKAQNLNYVNSNRYIAIEKGDTKNLTSKFGIQKTDLKFYNYSIYTTFNSFTVYAEPKIKYLKSRDISPKIYVYHKTLNQPPVIKWK